MFKFLHTADIHLDSPLLNLDSYDDVPRDEFRSATRRAFDNIVALAIAEQVQFVLIAGDLYDGDCTDFNTPLHFRRRMEELSAENIRVFIIQGNHDAANNMRKAFRLELPCNVHVFNTSKPETVLLEDLDVAIHGQGFAQRAVTDDLSKSYPEPIAGYINIGMLHTNCGSREGHDPYAPSTPKGLSAKGYQYWALGHIHKHDLILGPNPWIIYSGNPQGRHIGETGPRGCVIATVDGDRIDQKMHHVDVMRWYLVDVDTAECEEANAVVATVIKQIAETVETAPDLPHAIRVRLSGKTASHRELSRQSTYWDQQIREAVLDRFSERVWIEKIKFKTKPMTVPSDLVDSGTDELLAELKDPKLSQDARAELKADFEKMLSALPHDPRLPSDQLDLENDAAMAVIAGEARDMLCSRILDAGATE